MPRIQYRHKCSVCGRDSAVKPDGTIVNHGYTLQFHFMQGQCWGSNQVHFGTKEGLKITHELLQRTEYRMYELERTVPAVKEPSISPAHEKYKMWSHYHQLKSVVRFMKQHIDSWVEEDPREVEI